MAPLHKENSHPRDASISMHRASHVYFLNGSPMRLSGTGLKGKFMPAFDKEAALKGMFTRGGKDYTLARNLVADTIYPGGNKKYQGMTRKEILESWDRAASLGTHVHDRIEGYLDDSERQWLKEPLETRMAVLRNGGPLRADQKTEPTPHDDVFQQFLRFEDQWAKAGWEIYRVEWMIWDEELEMAGTADAVYRRRLSKSASSASEGEEDEESPRKRRKSSEWEYCIVDWKRSDAAFNSVADWKNKTCLSPIQEIPNSKLGGYNIQVNMYASVLRRCYGLNVTNYCIVQLRPGMRDHKIFPMMDDIRGLVEDTMFGAWKGHMEVMGQVEEWEERGGGLYDDMPGSSVPLRFGNAEEYD